jgi:hypothetical protein
MDDATKVAEWTRYYESCVRKMNALTACLDTDGERVTNQLLSKLGLGSALDMVKACRTDHLGKK